MASCSTGRLLICMGQALREACSGCIEVMCPILRDAILSPLGSPFNTAAGPVYAATAYIIKCAPKCGIEAAGHNCDDIFECAVFVLFVTKNCLTMLNCLLRILQPTLAQLAVHIQEQILDLKDIWGPLVPRVHRMMHQRESAFQ